MAVRSIFPDDGPIYSEINLVSRSTGMVGARRKPDQDAGTGADSSKQIKRRNNLVIKFSWPYKTRRSEAVFIQEAKEIGERNESVKESHSHNMLGRVDPPYLTCSTKSIREFLGLDADREWVLRVIAFHRLGEIKFLNEEHILIGSFDYFFSLFHGPCVTLWFSFCGRHWTLWQEGIEHRDVSAGNMMYDPVTKQGVLNDFNLAASFIAQWIGTKLKR